MIKVLDSHPVLFHGVDCIEFLLEDDSLAGPGSDVTCCDLCVYSFCEAKVINDHFVFCCELHSCPISSCCFYQILPNGFPI